MSVGLCVPNVCTDDNIRNLLKYVVPFINSSIMPIEFSGVDGVAATTKGQGLRVDDLILDHSFSLN